LDSRFTNVKVFRLLVHKRLEVSNNIVFRCGRNVGFASKRKMAVGECGTSGAEGRLAFDDFDMFKSTANLIRELPLAYGFSGLADVDEVGTTVADVFVGFSFAHGCV
jgi:hypothetical protein